MGGGEQEGFWLEPSRELEGGNEFGGGHWKEGRDRGTRQVLVSTNMGWQGKAFREQRGGHMAGGVGTGGLQR